MRIIGVHDGHNASAVLLTDGKIEFAMQEERITRIKNHSTFPSRSVQQILQYSKVSPGDIDYFVFSSQHMPKNKDREELKNEYRGSSSSGTWLRRMLKRTPAFAVHVHNRRKDRLKKAVELGFLEERILFQDHHSSHAAASYYGCPWRSDEPVLVLTNDAGGDGLCATVSIGKGDALERICEIGVCDSIGYIYSMITCLLGMVPEEHEYKIMGMAPYSSREKHQGLCRKFEELIEFNSADNGMSWTRRNGCPHTQYSYRFFRKFIESERFDWICGALQDFCENVVVKWVRNCIESTGIHKLALSGGVFMNVKANKRIMELAEVESLFVLPSCGDETNSIGAAFLSYAREKTKHNLPIDIAPLGPLYFGSEFTDEEIEDRLKEHSFEYQRHDNIEGQIARLLSEGEIVARFKGRMEFGARALGNRSILADPTKPEVVRTINEMIKNRDFWMPFAPSVLDERASDYLINPKGIASPYMIMSFDTTENIGDVRAASHPYDRTIRPQTVGREWNPEYYKLLKQFEKLTGRGAILNTSFNLHGYPIVCSPTDALEVFKNSGLKWMGIGNFLVRK